MSERAAKAALCGLLAGLVAGAAPAGELAVTDGDGLRVGDERIRLWGIDAPELEQQCERNEAAYSCGEEARDALRSFVQAGEVSCEQMDRDRYGRTVARCTVNGEDLGAAIVRAGWAVDFERYSDGLMRTKSVKPGWRNAACGPVSSNSRRSGAGRTSHETRHSFLPQICHKPKRDGSDKGGFLRVTEDTDFVAKAGLFGRFLIVTQS